MDKPQPHQSVQSFLTLRVEDIVFLVIGIISLLMHLWQLDGRALHHDETLHAAYSWYIFQGRDYMHDPLLHGPFLYYVGALVYFLFGDNDMTARLGFALAGTLLTTLPYIVRRELGRTAALFAALALLISPSFLYIGRFARHDIYSVLFEMLIFVAMVRYVSSRQPRWLYLAAIAFGCMYTNQETSYLFLLIMGIPLMLLFLWRVFKPGIALVAVAGVAIAALVFVLPGDAVKQAGDSAKRDSTTGAIQVAAPGKLFGWGPLETADNSYALRIRNRSDNYGGNELIPNIVTYGNELWQFFRHPAILSAIGVGIALLALLIWFIWLQRDTNGMSAWHRQREAADPIIAIYASLAEGRRWLSALALFIIIYAMFFTAFFTNILGFITGTTGSLLYWLAQHEVQRGGQPIHYYATLLVIYEPMLLLWGAVAAVMLIVQLVRKTPLHTLILPLFLAWWSLAAFLIYTWAGEKMPWLIVHIALPLTLFAAWGVQSVLSGSVQSGNDGNIKALHSSQRVLLTFSLIIFITASGLNYVVMTIFVGSPVRTDYPGLILVMLTSLLLLLLIVGVGINWGWQWALSVLALCITLIGSGYTFRSAYRLAYVIGDTPREMMIYTQTSPDVRRIVRNLEEISIRRTGGLDMPIYYDNETVWQWYLRNFTHATNTGAQIQTPPNAEVQVVLILQENLDKSEQTRESLHDFLMQRMPLRWWFPEERVYRLQKKPTTTDDITTLSLLTRLLYAPTDDDTLIPLWNFLIYRDPSAPLGSTDFVLAMRPEIAYQMGWGTGTTATTR